MAKLSITSKLQLNTGHAIPILGFGVYQAPSDICESVVSHALKVGYRHIDSAVFYHNEAQCGEAIRKSAIPRHEIFYTTKIPPRHLGYDSTKMHVDQSLKVSGLDYIDLMLIHAPYGGSAARKEAWKALVEAQEEGKIRSLGISNYGVHHLDELKTHMEELKQERGNAGKVSVGQWELHPWIDRSRIVKWCRERDVVLGAYSPLVRGERFTESSLQPLVKKYAKTPAQVLLRWGLQKGFVVLPKSATPSRIEENADVFDFELTEEEVTNLQTTEYSPCTWDPSTSALKD